MLTGIHGHATLTATVMAEPRSDYSDEKLRLAARLYYVDGLGQTEVAKLVKVSQAKVSRLLALARQRGIVRISVAEYEPRNADLEQELVARLGLQAAAVIKTVTGATGEEARRTVAHFGSAFVGSLIPRESVVAIAGGRTMRELVAHLPEDRERRVTVVQAMGSVDANVGPVDALELGRNMARRLGGFFLTLNTPAFVPDRKTRDALMALPQIRTLWQHLSRANVALIGIGTLDNSVFVDRGALHRDDCEQLSKQGAVGEICGRFFDRDGRECDSPWRDRVLGIELETLRQIPRVVAMVAGADRSAAIAAAACGGMLKTLVIDEAGALALIGKTAGSEPTRTRRRR